MKNVCCGFFAFLVALPSSLLFLCVCFSLLENVTDPAQRLFTRFSERSNTSSYKTMSAPKDVNAPAVAEEDDDCPDLEENESPADAAAKLAEAAAQMPMRGGGKPAKKYAKAMAKLGLKPEPAVMRVQIRKQKGMSFAIGKPEVYRFPNTNTFVIFGETQLEDGGSDAQRAGARIVTGDEGTPADKAPEPAADKKADDDDEEVDAEGIQEKEIEIVMTQANVSRAKAIKALKNNNSDIVNTIMELTM